MAVVVDATRVCPLCAEQIPAAAIRCPFCRSDLPTSSAMSVEQAVVRPAPSENVAAKAETDELDELDEPAASASASLLRRALKNRKVLLAAGGGLLVVATVVLALRPDKNPATVSVTGLPTSALTSRREITLLTIVKNKKGDTLAVTPSITVDPPGIAAFSSPGSLSCLKSGDFSLVLSAPPVLERVPVRCRPVSKVSAPAEMSLAMNSRPAKVAILAFDNEGASLSDVPVSFTSSDQMVVRVDGERLVSVGLGTATVTATAGEQSATVAVEVVENTLFQKFKLADGTSRMFPVHPAGRYVVHVKVVGDEGGTTGVELSFVGTSCAARGEARVHETTCDFGDDGVVVISNPSVLGMGPALNLRISLDREKT